MNFFSKIKTIILSYTQKTLVEDKENTYTKNNLYQKWFDEHYLVGNGERAPKEENNKPNN